MTIVVVPVRYPLTEHSHVTLRAAIDLAAERDANLTVLNVDRYQNDRRTTWSDLKSGVERTFGHLERTRYVVRRSFLVEDRLLDEVAAVEADVVVIGTAQLSKWRRAVRSLLREPDVESFLRERLERELVTVPV